MSVKQKRWYKRFPILNPAPGHDSPFENIERITLLCVRTIMTTADNFKAEDI